MNDEDMCYDMLIPVTYNRHNAKVLGVLASILFTELAKFVDIVMSDKPNRKVPWDGWFVHSVDDIYNHTGLTQDEQAQAIKVLKKEGIIDVKSIGLPAQRHFKINNIRK